MAYKVRNAREEFNESVQIGICLYTLFISAILLVALSFLTFTNVAVAYIIKSVIVFLATIPILVVLLLPQLILGYNGSDQTSSVGSKKSTAPLNSVGANGIQSMILSSPGHAKSNQATTMTKQIKITCIYKYAKVQKLLPMSQWTMTQLYFDYNLGLVSLIGPSTAYAPSGKCFVIQPSDVADIVVTKPEEHIVQLNCTLANAYWAFQTDKAADGKILQDALNTFMTEGDKGNNNNPLKSVSTN